MSVAPDRIVFFDGYCVFCNATVDWLMRHDRAGALRFAPLQGGTARARLPAEHVAAAGADPDSIIYLRDGEIFARSEAVARALRDLGGAPALMAAPLLMIPRGLRDFFYDAFARVRYRVFGKRESCRIPTPAERGRLLD